MGNLLKYCLICLLAAMTLCFAETADELFEKYRQEIVRLQHFGSTDGNPPDGYRELLPTIDKIAELAPGNPEYRLSALYHHVTIALYNDVSWTEKIKLYRQFIAEAAKFNADFSKWPKRIIKAERPAVQTCLLLNAFATYRNFDGRRLLPPPTEGELKELLSVLQELQRLCHEETIKKVGVELNDKPFASQREMIIFCNELTEECAFINDNATLFLTCKDMEKAILRRYLPSGKLDCGYLIGKGYPFPSFPAVKENCKRLFDDDLQGLRAALSDQEYLDLLEKAKSVELQLKLLSLKTLKKIVETYKPLTELATEGEAKERQKAMVAEVVLLYQQTEKLLGRPLKKDDVHQYFRNFMETFKWLCTNGFLPTLAYSQLESAFFNEYLKGVTAPVSDVDFLCNLAGRINSPDLTWDIFLSELEKHADGLAKHSVYELLKGNPTDVSYQIVSKCLYETDAEAARRIRAKLCPMQERLLKHPDLIKLLDSYGDFAEREEILNTIKEENWLEYVCCASSTAVYVSCWTLFYKFDIETGAMTPLPRIPLHPFEFRWARLSIEGNLCLAYTKDKLAIYNLDKAEWKTYQRAFPGELVSATVVGDQLFLLGYERLDAEKSAIALYQGNQDGSNGKLVFSTKDRASIDGLPSDPTLIVSDIVKATPESLLFLLVSKTGYDGILLEYNIPKNRLTTLHRLKTSAASVWLGRMPDGRIVGTNQRGFFLLEQGRLVNFINRSPNYVDPNARYNLKTYNVSPPLLLWDDYLISPERKQIVNLRNPEQSPVAWLPTSKAPMSFADGRFALMNNVGVWLFRLPRNDVATVDATPGMVRQSAVPIPQELLFFRRLYDLRLWVFGPLTLLWLVFAGLLLVRRRRSFLAWLLIFPLVVMPLWIGLTWCGWHYRMELRQRFAAYSSEAHAYSLGRMPANIRAEYARNDYHPRFRDIKAQVLFTIAFTPILLVIGFLLFHFRQKSVRQQALKPPSSEAEQ